MRVGFLDGETFSVMLHHSATVATLRQAVSRALLLQPETLKLCYGGCVLSDERTICSIPGTDITAWTSRQRPQTNAELERHEEVLHRERANAIQLQPTRGWRLGAFFVWETLSLVSITTWAKIALWLGMLVGARHLQFGVPFLITSAVVLMFQNLGTRRLGEASAYTVFNDDFKPLPGQLQVADFERELLHQVR